MKMRLLKLVQRGVLKESQLELALHKGLITQEDYNEIHRMIQTNVSLAVKE